jgi:type I restriction-modification system DNA methylase subunit
MSRDKELEFQVALYQILQNAVAKMRYQGIEINDVKIGYDIFGKEADIACLQSSIPFIFIETKRKTKDNTSAYSAFDRAVIGQAISYCAIYEYHVGKKIPYFMTATPKNYVIFKTPEKISSYVDLERAKESDYFHAIKLSKFQELIDKYAIDNGEVRLKDDFVFSILDLIGKNYSKQYHPKPQITYFIIGMLNDFVDHIADGCKYVLKDDANGPLSKDILKLESEIGSKIVQRDDDKKVTDASQLSRMMAYVFMNKLVFYKVLEASYKGLAELTGIGLENATQYLLRINELFKQTVVVTKDFEPIFNTGLFDKIRFPDERSFLKSIDDFIETLNAFNMGEVGELIGYAYENVIPAQERHVLGQFYTPPAIAELIAKWCIRSPDDIVLDPGVGSGTFISEAYKQLYRWKTGRSTLPAPSDVHRKILQQIYALDVNPFPLQLASMSISMKSVRAPSSDINMILSDFFTIEAGSKKLLPYTIKTVAGDKPREITLPKPDCIIGNPPYTRWVEIPEKGKDGKSIPGSTLWFIENDLKKDLEKYSLGKGIKSETGIYIPWIMHASKSLDLGKRLGMIISNSWLQTKFGASFSNFLLDNFKVKAVIDFSKRLFDVPLVATCVILLEKGPIIEDQDKTTLIYVSSNISVSSILQIIEDPTPSQDKGVRVNILKQSQILKNKQWIELLFNTDELTALLKENDKLTLVQKYFKTRYGNILGISERGGTGGDKFFYIDRECVETYSLHDYSKPLLSDPNKIHFLTLSMHDWVKFCKDSKKAYVFIAHKVKDELPQKVQEYIEWGEKEPLVSPKNKSIDPYPATESLASQIRIGKKEFFGWYDLKGIAKVRIYCTRRAWGWCRFALLQDEIALDEGAFIAFEDNAQNKLDEVEIKALLAYCNSSYMQLFINLGVTSGGGAVGLDTKSAENTAIIDIKKLSIKDKNELATLFDKLETETRKISGLNSIEVLFGMTTEDLISTESDPKNGIFNGIIAEIDYKVSQILGFQRYNDQLRKLTFDLIKRRLSRTGGAKPESVKGEYRSKINKPKKRKRTKIARKTQVLDVYFNSAENKNS